MDTLIIEATYADRKHESVADAEERLGDAVRRVAARGGKVLVPAFALGRVQELIYSLHQLWRNLKHFLEYRFLHVRPMNTDRAAAQFPAVNHDVIMLTADFFRIVLEQRDIFGHRSSERMMARIPTVLFLVETEQRKVHDPEEIETVRIDCKFALAREHVGAIKPDLAEDFACV